MSEDNTLPTNHGVKPACGAHKLYTAGLYLFAFTSNFSISAAQISLGLALIGFILLYRSGKITIKSSPLDMPFAFFAFTGLLSVFRAENLARAIPEMKTFLLIFCFYLAYWHDTSDAQQKNLLKLYLFSATLVSIISNFRAIFFEPTGYRATGFYSMSMTFGECQTLAILVAVIVFSHVRKGIGKQAFLALAAVSSTFSVLFSMVRSAYLGLFFGLGLLLIRFPKRTALILLITMAAATPFVLSRSELQDRFTGFNPQLTAEAAGKELGDTFTSDSLRANYHRMTTWWRGFQIFENQYVFGTGLSNVKLWYQRLASEFEFANNLIFGHQHNNFMQILVMSGLLSLIAFFHFIISTLKFTWNQTAPNQLHLKAKLRRGAVSIFIAYLAFGFGEYSWGDEEVSMMALFLTGMMVNQHLGQNEVQASEEVATAS